MSAVDADRTVGRVSANAHLRPPKDPHVIDVPSVLASQIASLYARGERERRNAGVERAIARARGLA